MFRVATLSQRVPIQSACENIDDELRRLVPYALKDAVLEDGSRVVAVVQWDRDSEAFLEPATCRAFVKVTARVLALSHAPGLVCVASPKFEDAEGTTATVGSATVHLRGVKCGHLERVVVRLVRQNGHDNTWEAAPVVV